MRIRQSFDKIILGIGVLACAGSLAWAQEYSHVRIVRLSFEEGTVTLTRPNAPGAAEAAVNTPIQEGFALATAEDSFAEVEFENSSTARVGQLSELGFNQLALDAYGNKLNGMELRQGYATFTVLPENGDVYEVRAGQVTVTLADDKAVRFRVDVDGANVRVEVFKGSVDVAGSFGQQRLAKNTVLEFDPGADEPLRMAQGITKDAWDEWVEKREDEAQLARRNSPPGNYTNEVNSYLYGWNDLYYYGTWNYIPGYGTCWIPAVTAGWIPYSYGQWVWYPGFGYTWVSSEPWGWLPFHYGGWFYNPSYGWAWVPGGFNAWSPALVSWYQGQTWVAWSPRPLRPRPGGGPTSPQSGCPGPACATVVSTQAFHSGLPVHGHRMPDVDVTASSAVDRPALAPPEAVRAGTAPTTAVGTATRTSGGMARPGGAPSAQAPRTSFEAAGDATGGHVVFDSREGRFVNGRESGLAKPAPSSASSTGLPETEASPAPSEAPSSTPARVGGSAPRSGQASETGHHASPRTGIESSHSQGVSERTLNSWGIGNSTSGQSSSSRTSRSNSGNWSAPSYGGGGGNNSGTSGASRSSSPSMSGGGGGGGGGASGGGGGRASSPHTSGATPHH
jgi:Family of unknown function (DUF6600)/FecR protein